MSLSSFPYKSPCFSLPRGIEAIRSLRPTISPFVAKTASPHRDSGNVPESPGRSAVPRGRSRWRTAAVQEVPGDAGGDPRRRDLDRSPLQMGIARGGPDLAVAEQHPAASPEGISMVN